MKRTTLFLPPSQRKETERWRLLQAGSWLLFCAGACLDCEGGAPYGYPEGAPQAVVGPVVVVACGEMVIAAEECGAVG